VNYLLSDPHLSPNQPFRCLCASVRNLTYPSGTTRSHTIANSHRGIVNIPLRMHTGAPSSGNIHPHTTKVTMPDAAGPDTIAASDSPACVEEWTCHVHGSLPLHRFAKEDLGRKRHRCKSCLAGRMALYRRQQPLRHMWHSFLQCARLNFGHTAVEGLCWLQHGRPLVNQLVNGMAHEMSLEPQQLQRCYKLAWESAEEFDLQKVHLVRKNKPTSARSKKPCEPREESLCTFTSAACA
jgi:hypothetical protein